MSWRLLVINYSFPHAQNICGNLIEDASCLEFLISRILLLYEDSTVIKLLEEEDQRTPYIQLRFS